MGVRGGIGTAAGGATVAGASDGVPYWRLSGYYFFYFAFIGGFSPYFGLFLQARGLSPWQIAVLLSQMAVMRVLAPILWGWIADHTGRRVGIVRLAGAVSVIGVGGFFLAQGFWAWLVAMAVLAFFWSAALPLVEALTQANKLSSEGLQAVASRQAERLRKGIEQVSKNLTELSKAGAAEARVALQADFTKAAFDQTLTNLKELAAMAQKSNAEAFEVI